MSHDHDACDSEGGFLLTFDVCLDACGGGFVVFFAGKAEAGNLVFMEDGIEMDTNTGGGAGSMFRR